MCLSKDKKTVTMIMKSKETAGGGKEERSIFPVWRHRAHREKSFGDLHLYSRVTREGVSSFRLLGICSKMATMTD